MVQVPGGRAVVFRCALIFGLSTLIELGCGGPQPLGALGAVCFRPDDCQAGLECVPETMGAKKRVCKADLSGIVSMVDAGTATGGSSPAEATNAGGAGG